MKNIIFIATTIITSTGLNLTAMDPEFLAHQLAEQPAEIIQQIMAELSDRGLLNLAWTSRRFYDLAQPGLNLRRQRREFEAAVSGNGLNLSCRDLQYIMPGVFQKLGNLQRLNLEKNRLENLRPGVFQGLVDVEVLGLSENRLNNLRPEIFKNLGKLRWLCLRGNPLSPENVKQLREALPGVTIFYG